MRGHFSKVILLLLSLVITLTWGCSTLKESHTAWPIKEYEKMIAGRLDADYVGTDTCVEKCHAHDRLTRDFRMSVHSGQVSSGTGLPLVNCESCHGPGSLAIENISNNTCDFKTFIALADLPSGAQALICLKCHSSFSLGNLSGWTNSRHATANLSCSSCHKLHQGVAQKATGEGILTLCVGCHRSVEAEFSLPSHHPVPEGKMTCTTCHDQHGSTHDNNLRKSSIKEVCVGCHADKTGPFLVEHGASVTEDCTTCHSPHGSINTAMTTYSQPFLCLQCHGGHNAPRRPILTGGTFVSRETFFGVCTNCHSQVHGTDIPGWRPDGGLYR